MPRILSAVPLQDFHPAVASWFRRTFPAPTEAQVAAWPAIRAGRHTLVAAPTGSGKTLTAFLAALDGLVRDGLAAGVKQQLEADAARVGGVRLLPGRFMVIEQAMGVSNARSDVAVAEIAAFVERVKASGFVAAALARHRIQGAVVAPASAR